MGRDVATSSPVISVSETMARKYTAEESLEYLIRSSDEENASSDEPVDDTSGEEDYVEIEPDLDSEEEDLNEEQPVTFTSRNEEVQWSSFPPAHISQGRARAEEVLRQTPGPTRYACSRLEDI